MKTKTEAAEVGVIVGRWQVPNLHEVHREIIQKVIDTHPRVLIFIGLAPDSCRCTYNNPLDYVTRRAMIQKEFPDVEIHYIKDQPTDTGWSNELDNQIKSFTGVGQKVILYGSRDSFIPHYTGKFPTVELVATKIISGKEIRKNVGIKSKDTAAFREGVIWGVENQWASVLPTVDFGILDRPNKRVLVARKPQEENVRFSGGFASVDSDSYEDDVKREASEETGLEVDNLIYLGSIKVNDWRYQSERNKPKTLFFAVDYIFGSPMADDDISEVRWLSYDELRTVPFQDEHRPLVKMLLNYLEKTHLIDHKMNEAPVQNCDCRMCESARAAKQ